MATQQSFMVTGGASGIGRASCLLLAEAGHIVTVADINVEQGEALSAEICQAGGRAQFVKIDVVDENSVRNAVENAIKKFGQLHGAINCAGLPQAGQAVYELTAENWDRGINVNLRGMFLCVKHQGAAMLSAGGSIVCVSSAAASKGLINSAEYCASKAGITGLVRAAAIDFAKRGVRINALLPGATDTPLAQQSREANPAIVGTLQVPLGRVAEPREVAAGAIWLVSEAASYMTGACIALDGGMSIA